MAEGIQNVLYLSCSKLSDQEYDSFKSRGFDITLQNHADLFLHLISSIRPFGLIVDGKLCGSALSSSSGLLQKIQKSYPGVPVFLLNATGAQRYELLKSDLAYAVFPPGANLSTVLAAISRYKSMLQSAGAKSKIRFGVSLPCMVKKLGASGLVQGEICDLSPNGMKVRIDAEQIKWEAGDEVRFSLNQKTSSAGQLEGFGQLRWSITDEVRPGIKETRMGFEFSQLPPPTLHAFLDLLNDARVTA